MRGSVRRGLATAATVAAACGVVGPGPAASAPALRPVPHEAVVRFAPGTPDAVARGAIARAGARVLRAMDLDGAYHLRAGDVDRATAALRAHPRVREAHPNNRYAIAWRPNDSQLSLQWALENRGQTVNGVAGTNDADIDALEAWDRSTGSGMVVAVLDSGIDRIHPDLASALWTNPGEVEGNGADDDGNGKVDDVVGWDFVGDDPDPTDGVGHGTHVSGTLGARAGDGRGVAGVAPDARIMSIRAVPDDGNATDVTLADGIVYAAENGARIVNISLSGPDDGGILAGVMREQPGMLFVVAAGNEGVDVDAEPSYPCALDVPNIVCVAGSDQRDGRAGSSNFGNGTIEVVAPGENIVAPAPGGGYAYLSGTSMATPHAAGAAALAWSMYPGSGALDVRRALMDGSDRPGRLAGVSMSGRVNAARGIDALSRLQPFSVAAPPGLTSPAVARFRNGARNVRPDNVVLRVDGSTSNIPATPTCRGSGGGVVSCVAGDVATVSLQPRASLLAGQRYHVLLNPGAAPPATGTTGTPLPAARVPFRASTIEQEWTTSGVQGWRIEGHNAAFGGSFAVEHLAGARIHHRFTGTEITWYTVAGPGEGSAVVVIDGQPQATIDNARRSTAFRVAHSFGGLLEGEHTITIAVRGDGRVAVDAFRYGGTLLASPRLTYQWRIVAQRGASDGKYVEADYAGAAMAFTFRGTGVDWYPARTPAGGTADVFVDGRRVATVDTYAPSLSLNQPVVVRGLADGVHTLRVLVLGKRRAPSRGARVATDKYVVR